ncbi:MAG: hypothetical protein RQ729_09735 [Wenzhouxiangellaceae bacterium]|nr:hypothetical protein [Wenzhouxiangellaceae bacterium]
MEHLDREQALEVIAALARAHRLTAAELERTRVGTGLPPRRRRGPDWVRTLLALMGGLFVLAGLLGLLQLIWHDLSSPARVIAVFGSGLVLLVLGLVAVRDPAFERAASPLLLVAGLFQTAGLFVLLHEYWLNLDDAVASMLVFGVMSAQFVVLFGTLRRTDLLFLLLVSVTLFLAATLTWLDVDHDWIALALGGAGLLVTFGLERTAWRGVCGLAWVVYALLLAIGVYEVVEGAFPFDLLMIILAALLIQLSVYIERRSLLGVAVLIMLGYLGYYTGEYFADMLGWPIALIVFGLALLALSGYAFRLGRSMVGK